MNEWNSADSLLPYDPTDVDIRQQTLSLDMVLRMITYHEIELWLEEGYQRKSKAWDLKQKSRLIESLIMRIPLPIFYFDGSEDPWKVIDGLHRLTTLFSFIVEDGWKLKDLEFLRDFEGLKFSQLPFKYQRSIRQSSIEAYIINPGTPNRVKLNIFQRINTGGTALTRQEIRNSYYSGVKTDFLAELANSKEFLSVTRGKISTNRMKDMEAVLRFIGFYKYLDDYNAPLEKFLDETMAQISSERHELADLKTRFLISMALCEEIFGDKAFYVLDNKLNRNSNNINIALFETWSVNLAKLTENQCRVILSKKAKVLNRFRFLFRDVDFHKSISASTSSKKAVFTRFQFIDKLLKDIIDAN